MTEQLNQKEARVKKDKKYRGIHVRSLARNHTASIGGSETIQRMAEAVTTLIASLDPGQKTRIIFSTTDEERFNWHYIPRERKGVSLKELNGGQQKLAHRLIASGLSRSGYAKAMAIMGLETILKEIEGPSRRFERDPDLYYITVFGNPSEGSPWGWRLEGHHVSLNFLIVGGGQIAPAPSFFGANPAQVPPGYPLAGFRTLLAEEDLARDLLATLNSLQRSQTFIGSEAPSDIVTRAEVRVKSDNPTGLSASKMTEDQQGILTHLLLEYISRMPDDVADHQMDQIEKEGKKYIHFAWAGPEERGQPHYYRLHGPSFLVEYDNTQNNANHIHTVWRDLRNDWGEDFLRSHYEKSHGSGR